MISKRIPHRAYLLATTVAVTILAAASSHYGQEPHQMLPRTAFTAVEITYRFDVNGGLGRNIVSLFAVQSDGTTVELKQMVGADSVNSQVIRSVLQEARIVTLPVAKAVTTYPLSKEYVDFLRRRPTSCTTDTNAERQSYLGYEVLKISQDRRGEMVEEYWVAPALDCYPLRSTVRLANGAFNEKLVVSVTEGDPDLSLFEVPPDYTEMSPSEVSAELIRLGKTGIGPEDTLAILDEAYVRSRVER